MPIAQGYPEAEVIAIDTAGASLRYGAARAAGLGVTNIRFVQADGEDLSRFPDNHFDWVQTTMFLHELSAASMPRILAEAWRVLKPGGLMLHVEQPQYGPDMPLFEQFMRDWDAFNNNEPFWSAMHGVSMTEVMQDAGFSPEEQFSIGVRAVVDPTIFPPSPDGGQEDYGRAPSGTPMAPGRPRLRRRWQHDARTGLDRRSRARAKGRRPAFFDEPAVDRLYSLSLALMAELSATRERLDTVERLLEAGGSLKRRDIEDYAPDRIAGEERGEETRAYIARVMRGFQQEVEAMEQPDPPIMDIVEQLSAR